MITLSFEGNCSSRTFIFKTDIDEVEGDGVENSLSLVNGENDFVFHGTWELNEFVSFCKQISDHFSDYDEYGNFSGQLTVKRNI